jgi:hypothetical protein
MEVLPGWNANHGESLMLVIIILFTGKIQELHFEDLEALTF